MLPKNKLRDRRLERLKIFVGPNTGVFGANVIKRWEDGTMEGPTDKQRAKWEKGVLPEYLKLKAAKERKAEKARVRHRAKMGLPF